MDPADKANRARFALRILMISEVFCIRTPEVSVMEARSSTPPSASSAAAGVEADLQTIAMIILAVESLNGGPGFVTFHFDKGESFASAAEDIGGDFQGSNSAEFRKKLSNRLVGLFRRQVADIHFFQMCFLIVVSGGTRFKITDPAKTRGVCRISDST